MNDRQIEDLKTEIYKLKLENRKYKNLFTNQCQLEIIQIAKVLGRYIPDASEVGASEGMADPTIPDARMWLTLACNKIEEVRWLLKDIVEKYNDASYF